MLNDWRAGTIRLERELVGNSVGCVGLALYAWVSGKLILSWRIEHSHTWPSSEFSSSSRFLMLACATGTETGAPVCEPVD